MTDRTRSFQCRVLVLLLVCFVAGALTACGGGGEQSDGPTLTVLAASSLTDAFGELETTFEVKQLSRRHQLDRI